MPVAAAFLARLPLLRLWPLLLAAVGGADVAGPAAAPQQPQLPPGSWVTPEAVAQFRAAVDARAKGELTEAPDKLEDQWTVSRALRRDLQDQLTDFAENLTVLEVGSYFGYTTRLLSERFARVIALDAVPQLLQANREYNWDRDNILYLRFHTLDDDWGLFAHNTIHVVFLDASHDLETVFHDVENCLRLSTVNLIIFDDYGAEEGVRAAVHEFIARERLRPLAFLGEGADGQPWRLRDGREVRDREAIACEVVRPGGLPAAPEGDRRGPAMATPPAERPAAGGAGEPG